MLGAQPRECVVSLQMLKGFTPVCPNALTRLLITFPVMVKGRDTIHCDFL